jgi:hypothetical protein
MQEMQDDSGVHMARTPRAKTTIREYVAPKVTLTPTTIPIKLLIGAAGTVKDKGPVTGQPYAFHPGEVTLVDVRDFECLLARRTNPKRCCGGKSPASPQPLYGIA